MLLDTRWIVCWTYSLQMEHLSQPEGTLGTLVGAKFSLKHALTSPRGPHAHFDYVMSYYFAGRPRCRIGAQVLQFETGNIGLLNRGETHEDLDLAEQRDYLMVGVKEKFFGELLQGIGSRIDELPYFSVAKLDRDSHIQRICEDLRSEYEGRELGREFVLTSLVTELAIYILRLFTSPSADSANASDIQGLRWQVRKALEYLQDTFTEDFALERVAAAANFSKYHLDRVFKRATGVRPHTYVMILRVERAKELLTHTSGPIIDIALDLGFADQSHFSNVFKQFVGVSPRAYRESAKGNSKQQ